MAYARLTLLVAFVVSLCACGGGAAPTAPETSTTPQAIAPSIWKGTLDVQSCTGSALGVFCNGPEAFVLRLNADGTALIQIDVDGDRSGPAWAVPLTPFAFGNLVSLTGTSTGGLAPTLRAIDVSLSLNDKTDPNGASFSYTVSSSSTPAVKKGRVLFAERSALVFPSKFQGEWQGLVTRSQCTGLCTTFSDEILRIGDVRLSLSDSSGGVTGLLNGHAITATVSGNSINGAGHFEQSGACHAGFDSGTTCFWDITFSATVDDADRMHGTVSYRVSGVDDGNIPFQYTGSGTLDGLVRWP